MRLRVGCGPAGCAGYPSRRHARKVAPVRMACASGFHDVGQESPPSTPSPTAVHSESDNANGNGPRRRTQSLATQMREVA
eukprot:2835141-Rhodomonas_salina.1